MKKFQIIAWLMFGFTQLVASDVLLTQQDGSGDTSESELSLTSVLFQKLKEAASTTFHQINFQKAWKWVINKEIDDIVATCGKDVLNQKDSMGNTVLHKVIELCEKSFVWLVLVDKLIVMNVDKNQLNDSGKSPLLLLVEVLQKNSLKPAQEQVCMGSSVEAKELADRLFMTMVTGASLDAFGEGKNNLLFNPYLYQNDHKFSAALQVIKNLVLSHHSDWGCLLDWYKKQINEQQQTVLEFLISQDCGNSRLLNWLPKIGDWNRVGNSNDLQKQIKALLSMGFVDSESSDRALKMARDSNNQVIIDCFNSQTAESVEPIAQEAQLPLDATLSQPLVVETENSLAEKELSVLTREEELRAKHEELRARHKARVASIADWGEQIKLMFLTHQYRMNRIQDRNYANALARKRQNQNRMKFNRVLGELIFLKEFSDDENEKRRLAAEAVETAKNRAALSLQRWFRRVKIGLSQLPPLPEWTDEGKVKVAAEQVRLVEEERDAVTEQKQTPVVLQAKAHEKASSIQNSRTNRIKQFVVALAVSGLIAAVFKNKQVVRAYYARTLNAGTRYVREFFNQMVFMKKI
jgi:hypothetical protein